MNAERSASTETACDADPRGSLIEYLRTPTAYPEHPTTVEVVETHISWVFLTDRYAYKLKKPVKFEFLDFSKPQLRQAACEQELRLNRRLAREIYLDVVPVTRDRRGRWHLGGQGPAVDWLVRMRRLPADQTLEQLILRGRIGRREVDQLAKRLVDFYRELPPVSLRTENYRRAIEQHVRANGVELGRPAHQLPAGLIGRAQTAQLRLLRTQPEWWDARVCDGRVVEGHGDLRPEHVYFHPHPLIIDAIEFNVDLRTIDVLDELGFLAMECALLGASWVGEQIIEQYQVAMGDHPPDGLLRFYESYRACVRAKVCVLRGQQLAGDARERARTNAIGYLTRAHEIIVPSSAPLLIVVGGLSGTGKSVVAAALAEQLACRWLSTDVVRRELLGPASGQANYGADRYSLEQRDRIYQRLFQQADSLLREGISVILDGTFLKFDWLRTANDLATERHADFALLRCECPPAVAAERVAQRRTLPETVSEIAPEFLARQETELDPKLAEFASLRIDTTQSLPDLLAAIYEYLRASQPLASVVG